MNVGDAFFSVHIDFDEEYRENEENYFITKSSCDLNKYIITSIQKRKGKSEKYVYYGVEIVHGARKTEIMPFGSIPISEFDMRKHPTFSTTEIGALKKALRTIPNEIKRHKEWAKEDEVYHRQYIDCYDKTIRGTLSRMISSREKKQAKTKARKQ